MEKQLQKNKVIIAFLENNKAAIVSGLNSAREVITEGVGYLTDKSTVKVMKNNKVMKGNNSIADELLTVLSQWYGQTVKRYQLIFSSPVY